MPEKLTKTQIILWLNTLIDQGEAPARVLEALATLEHFITWWQTAHHQAWDPWQWTEADDAAYQAAFNFNNRMVPSSEIPHSVERVLAWLRRFRMWLIDQEVLPGTGR